jgi:hypothetical protein
MPRDGSLTADLVGKLDVLVVACENGPLLTLSVRRPFGAR